MWSKKMLRAVVLGGLIGASNILANQPVRPDAVLVEETDAQGTVTWVGYLFTYLLDYDAESVEAAYGGRVKVVGDYNVSGTMHGIWAGQRYASEFGWNVQASYGSGISLGTLGAYNTETPEDPYFVQPRMSRFDIEAVALLPVPRFLRTFVDGFDAGIKYAQVERDWWLFWPRYEPELYFEQTNTWIGPMAGVFGNVPLRGAGSPLSILWIANIMYTYGRVKVDEEGQGQAALESDWVFGINGTIGLSYRVTNRIDLAVGYRAQMLGDQFPRDRYQGIIASVRFFF